MALDQKQSRHVPDERNANIGRFRLTTADELAAALQRDRRSLAFIGEIENWLSDLKIKQAKMLELKPLLWVLTALERYLADCIRRHEAQSHKHGSVYEHLEELEIPVDCSGVRLAIRALLHVRAIAVERHPEAAEQIILAGFATDMTEIEWLHARIEKVTSEVRKQRTKKAN